MSGWAYLRKMVEFSKKIFLENQHCIRVKLMRLDLMGTLPVPSQAQCFGLAMKIPMK